MSEAVNIATMAIADKVHRHMNASYYVTQLETLKTEAKALGYFFAQVPTAAFMTSSLADHLARKLAYRRKTYLHPQDSSEDWLRGSESEMKSGYAQEHLHEMLTALSALGLHLQEGPEAQALREPLSDAELFRLVNQFAEDTPT